MANSFNLYWDIVMLNKFLLSLACETS